jgi:hypothetical protein
MKKILILIFLCKRKKNKKNKKKKMKSEKKGGTKTKIICKYFIQGKCVKGESCPYLHSKVEKPKEIITIECPMYNVGFCKNGRNCCFMHIKKEKYIEEKSDEKKY